MTTERKKGTSNWLVFTAIGVGGILVVVGAAFFAVSLLLVDWLEDFCTLLGALQFALEAGEDTVAAAEAFLADFDDRMIDSLAPEYRDTARLLLKAVTSLAGFIGAVIGALVPTEQIARILDLITQLDGACKAVDIVQ